MWGRRTMPTTSSYSHVQLSRGACHRHARPGSSYCKVHSSQSLAPVGARDRLAFRARGSHGSRCRTTRSRSEADAPSRLLVALRSDDAQKVASMAEAAAEAAFEGPVLALSSVQKHLQMT